MPMPITERNRCHFIGINTPQEDAAKRVVYCRERVIEDGEAMIGKALVQPADLAIPFLPTLATTVRTIYDKVLQCHVTLSGAGLAEWMTRDYDERNLADVTPAPAVPAVEPVPDAGTLPAATPAE